MTETDPRVVQAIAAIRDDRIRGAAELAGAALDTLTLAARLAAERAVAGAAVRVALGDTARQLVLSRPSMAAVVNAVAAGLELLAPPPAKLTAEAVASAVAATRAELEAGTAAVVRLTAATLAGRTRVVTLSYSSSVAAAIAAADDVGETVVGEARPGLEGRQLARRLAEAGRPVALVTDAQLGRLITADSTVLLGADTILPDGSIVNKAGSSLLAAWAATVGAPVYVAADSSKLAAWWRPGDPVELEASGLAEIWPDPPPGVRIENVLFDVTPAHLVTAYLTERGPLAPASLTELAHERAGRYAEVYGWWRQSSPGLNPRARLRTPGPVRAGDYGAAGRRYPPSSPSASR